MTADATVAAAWARQSVWSQVANRLKRDIERKRFGGLVFMVLGAVTSASAVITGLTSSPGRVLAFASAVCVGLAGILRAQVGVDAVKQWTRARSVSEGIKSEVFTFLAGAGTTEAELEQRVWDIEQDAADLQPLTVGVAAVARALPPVRTIGDYRRERVTAQIETYYRPRAAMLQGRLKWLRRAGHVLAVIGVVLAAAAGVWKARAIAAWVPVVTTVAASVAAYAGASRYEYQVIEFERTARELERLLQGHLTDAELIARAEEVISIENKAWMAKLSSPGDG